MAIESATGVCFFAVCPRTWKSMSNSSTVGGFAPHPFVIYCTALKNMGQGLRPLHFPLWMAVSEGQGLRPRPRAKWPGPVRWNVGMAFEECGRGRVVPYHSRGWEKTERGTLTIPFGDRGRETGTHNLQPGPIRACTDKHTT